MFYSKEEIEMAYRNGKKEVRAKYNKSIKLSFSTQGWSLFYDGVHSVVEFEYFVHGGGMRPGGQRVREILVQVIVLQVEAPQRGRLLHKSEHCAHVGRVERATSKVRARCEQTMEVRRVARGDP